MTVVDVINSNYTFVLLLIIAVASVCRINITDSRKDDCDKTKK
jgi:hypothetical protein